MLQNMDPFARFRRNIGEKKVRKLPEELVRGQLYLVNKLERKLSDFKDKEGRDVWNLIAHFRENATNFYVYMGSDFNNPTIEEVNAFNQLCANGQNPRIAFYGYQGKAKIMDLLRHNEGVDEERMGQCTAHEVALKRSSSSSVGSSPVPSPSKVFVDSDRADN
ncbi:uncharacterized protein LOC113206804 [Frankliniella occidentalis]|uniref:Uncharacterized protein LOC113206804 n=1 Tax=Frankliniella occidentalis TaxID=133901 RepID=A0A6J1SDT7_FRAOC|nr:uncharacterized protein LOC113206804 [Frankliniella occidentalis]